MPSSGCRTVLVLLRRSCGRDASRARRTAETLIAAGRSDGEGRGRPGSGQPPLEDWPPTLPRCVHSLRPNQRHGRPSPRNRCQTMFRVGGSQVEKSPSRALASGFHASTSPFASSTMAGRSTSARARAWCWRGRRCRSAPGVVGPNRLGETGGPVRHRSAATPGPMRRALRPRRPYCVLAPAAPGSRPRCWPAGPPPPGAGLPLAVVCRPGVRRRPARPVPSPDARSRRDSRVPRINDARCPAPVPGTPSPRLNRTWSKRVRWHTLGHMTTALITGANKGLGFETARRLADLGWTVHLGARDPQLGMQAATQLSESGGDVHFVELDVTSDESVGRAFDALEPLGALDVLVNNAGIIGTRLDPLEVGPQDFLACFGVNLLGPVRVTRSMLPLLERSDHPRIVMVSSGMGSITITSDPERHESTIRSLVYPSSKAALNMVTTQYAEMPPQIPHQRRRPRLYGHRPQRSQRVQDGGAGGGDHRRHGAGRPRRPDGRFLQRRGSRALVTSMPAEPRPAEPRGTKHPSDRLGRMAAPGPLELGRGVVVLPGMDPSRAPGPRAPGWSSTSRCSTSRLPPWPPCRQAWSARQPITVELAVDSRGAAGA